MEQCLAARPGISISISLHRGLDELQQIMDTKKLKRLDKQVRHSTVLSLGF